MTQHSVGLLAQNVLLKVLVLWFFSFSFFSVNHGIQVGVGINFLWWTPGFSSLKQFPSLEFSTFPLLSQVSGRRTIGHVMKNYYLKASLSCRQPIGPRQTKLCLHLGKATLFKRTFQLTVSVFLLVNQASRNQGYCYSNSSNGNVKTLSSGLESRHMRIQTGFQLQKSPILVFQIAIWRFNEWELNDFWVTWNVKALLPNLCSRTQATIDKQR